MRSEDHLDRAAATCQERWGRLNLSDRLLNLGLAYAPTVASHRTAFLASVRLGLLVRSPIRDPWDSFGETETDLWLVGRPPINYQWRVLRLASVSFEFV